MYIGQFYIYVYGKLNSDKLSLKIRTVLSSFPLKINKPKIQND